MRSINKILIVVFIFLVSVQLYSITEEEKKELEHKAHDLFILSKLYIPTSDIPASGEEIILVDIMPAEFCKWCHLMNDDYNSWKISTHGKSEELKHGVECIHCHSMDTSGFMGQVKAKFLGGPVQLWEYLIDSPPHVELYKKLRKILKKWDEWEIEGLKENTIREINSAIEKANAFFAEHCTDSGHEEESEGHENKCILILDEYLKEAGHSKEDYVIPIVETYNDFSEYTLPIINNLLSKVIKHLKKPEIPDEMCTQCHLESNSYTKLDARGNNSFEIKYISSADTIEEKYTAVEHIIHSASVGTFIKKYGKSKQTKPVRCQECHDRIVHGAVKRNPIYDETDNYAYKVRANKYSCFKCHLKLIEEKVTPLNPDFNKVQFITEEPPSETEKKEKLVKIVRSFLGYSIQALRKLNIDDLVPFKARPDDIDQLSIDELEEIVMRANYTEEEVEMFTSEDEENIFREATSMGFVTLPACTVLCHPPLP